MIKVGEHIQVRAYTTGHYRIKVLEICSRGISGEFQCDHGNGFGPSDGIGFFIWDGIDSIVAEKQGELL